MANNIQVIQDKSGNNVFPITHERAVRDSAGVNLETKLSQLGNLGLYKTYALRWEAYKNEYFTITALEDDTAIELAGNDESGNYLDLRIDYSQNDGATWVPLYIAGEGSDYVREVNKGEKVIFRCDEVLSLYNDIQLGHIAAVTFLANKPVLVSGNIMSLCWGDNFRGKTTFPNFEEDLEWGEDDYPTYFAQVFLQSENLRLDPMHPLVLPATELKRSCYEAMFEGCTGLTTAPELPATTLADYCYSGMFRGCSGLTTAPELPATTLADNCYGSMFSNCTGLTVAPELPAIRLASGCYSNMFRGCTGLTTAPELPATTLAGNCYSQVFYGCTGLTVAPELPATTLANACYAGMFFNCTGLTTALELPATTLASYCYSQMFQGCTSLTSAPELPATTLATRCYYQMFRGCTSLTTAPELPATTLTDYCYNYMFYGCTGLNYVKCLATNISATDSHLNWLQDVAATGTFVKAGAMSSWPSGASGVPSGWTIEDDIKTSYFTLEAADPYSDYTEFRFICPEQDNGAKRTISVSTDGGINWTQYTSSYGGTVIALLHCGEKALIKGTNSAIGFYSDGEDAYEGNYFYADGPFYAYGNVMSLISGDNFGSIHHLTASNKGAFAYLFSDYNGIQTPSSLISHPTKALVLPATGLVDNCYANMFLGCTGLTVAPELPATTLANYCYAGMFQGCTGLTTAPELPATTLTDYCYNEMFRDCTGLTTAPELPATTLASRCYINMFYGCTGLTTAPELPATTLTDYCYSSMFQGCTSLTSAPELPATTLATRCYMSMFYDCTSLNYVKCLATNISATDSHLNWLQDVAATGTFVKAGAMSSWPSGANGIPSGWTVQNAT